ncbi:hypothetical protein BDQ17DRAFT_1342881 [Cyathus striatus]|nr:hypothetical protein BDQ17DRAFT_1342881 [Cyathus striatus]
MVSTSNNTLSAPSSSWLHRFTASVLDLRNISGLIVDHIATSEDNYADLKSCALASRVFTHHCQRYIFYKLDLWHFDRKNPRLLSYVRILRICLREGRESRENNVWCSVVENSDDSEILERLSSVEEFHLCGAGDKFGCPPKFHDYICKILSLASLKSVTFSSGVDFTWSPLYFVHMLHVQDLYLDLVHMKAIFPAQLKDLLSQVPVSKYHDRKQLRRLHIGGSAKETTDTLIMLHNSPNTSFELSHIKELQFDPTMMANVESCWNVLQLCSKSLQKLIWCCGNHVDEFQDIPVNLGILENLHLMVYYIMDFNQIMEDFTHLHKVLSTTSRSLLEYFELVCSTIATSHWQDSINEAEEYWRRLDKDLAKKELFPMLQYVKIKLVVPYPNDSNEDNREKLLTYFPHLSYMNDVRLNMVFVDDLDDL